MPTSAEMLSAAWRHFQAGHLPQAEQICRQLLTYAPQDGGAWHLLGLLAYQVGRFPAAEECIRRATAAEPYNGSFFSNLALVQNALRRSDAAIESGRRAVQLRPELAEAHNNLANALKDAGQLPDAVEHYRKSLALKPDYAVAYNNLATALHQLDRDDEALAAYQQALAFAPQFAEVHNNLGNLLRDQRRFAEARKCYERALELNPRYADAYSNLGVALDELSLHQDAVTQYQRALELQPTNAVALANLGAALRKIGRYDDAVTACREALRLQPGFVGALNNLGTALEDLGRIEEAIETYQQALAREPNYVDALVNLSNAQRCLGRLDAAIASCEQAIVVKHDNVEAHSNRGLALTAAGKVDDALADYRQALAIDPLYADAHWNQSLALLLKGDFAAGWREYEWRWRRTGAKSRKFLQPVWDGRPLAGRRILLYSEQGLGDTIQFIRYAPLVRQRGGEVILDPHKPLWRLLQSCRGIDRLLEPGETLPTFDVQCPLLSLPGLFQTDLATIPAEVPYFVAAPELVDYWRAQLVSERRLKVGIAWQGSRTYPNDRFRSIPLAEFASLAGIQKVQLYSLQKGFGREQLDSWAQRAAIVDLADRIDETTGPFVDTAAVMMNLDLVITSDTSIAHLAGALGVPTWVALSTMPDWRWLLDRDDSPWYPTMRLFRQTKLGQWSDVFDRINAALTGLLAEHGT